MRKLGLVLMLLFALALAACGESSAATTPTDTPMPPAPTSTTAASPTAGSTGPTITMGAFSFTGNSATVKAGGTVTFNDPASSGGTHIIVTGTSGKFTAASGAPMEFATASGVSFSPGDSKAIKFPTAGTFTFTCTIHPSMHATVTVTP